jgi:hypothetical protein
MQRDDHEPLLRSLEAVVGFPAQGRADSVEPRLQDRNGAGHREH